MGEKKTAQIEKKGGYPAGDKPLSQLPPVPKGPGVGSKPSGNGKPANEGSKADK